MKFRNYCAVIMGKFNKQLITDEITKLSESTLNSIDTGGIMIITFTSVFEPIELGETLRNLKVNYLVFDLDSKSSSVNLLNPMIHEGLFGLINSVTSNHLDDMTNRLIKDIASSSTTSNQSSASTNINNKKVRRGPSEDEISKMTKNEKEELLNKYIDNGLENLTESEKKIIELLAK